MYQYSRRYPALCAILCGSALMLLSLPTQAATAQLFVKPEAYVGSCPTRIYFNGIVHSHYAGKVQYRFIRSDNANTPVKTIMFLRPGKQKVSSSWTLGGPGLPRYDGWQVLEITYPVHSVSNKARFSIRCRQGISGDVNNE